MIALKIIRSATLCGTSWIAITRAMNKDDIEEMHRGCFIAGRMLGLIKLKPFKRR